MFHVLKEKDIEEKLQLDLKKGFTLESWRHAIQQELFEQRRITIRSRIQECNLEEQLAYADKKIKEKKEQEEKK